MKQIMKNKKVLVAMVSLFVLGVVIGAKFMAPSPSPVTIYPQSFYGGSSYMIDRVGSTYYAVNGETGDLINETDFTTLFDTIVDALPVEGGRITLRAAEYVGYIVIDRSNVVLEGEGVFSDVNQNDPSDSPTYLGGTVIKPPSEKDGIYLKGADLSNVQIRNLGIWFTTTSTGHGITTDVDQNFHLRDAVIENIMVLDHDGDSYALRLSNFLFLNIRHVLAWGGSLLEIYANKPDFQQGNSIFDDLYGYIKYDLSTIQYVGAYPIFIHSNDSARNTWTNSMQIRRIQVNNPIYQPSGYYWQAMFRALRSSTISDLDLEGVNAEFVNMAGGCYNNLFDTALCWAMNASCSFNVAAGNYWNTFINMQIHGDLMDANKENVWVSPYFTGIIVAGSQANFIGLDGNSGYDVLASGQTEKNVTACFIGVNNIILLTIMEADNLRAGESLKVESMSTTTNSFIVKCIDEGTASTDIGFFWEVKQKEN